MYKPFFPIALLVYTACSNPAPTERPASDTTLTEEAWTLGPFQKVNDVNPVLEPKGETTFLDPIRQETLHWEVKDVFNPATVVRNDTVFMIYRAEDSVGIYQGTSRLGLAKSTDGLHFIRLPEPVFYPANDFMKKYEWEGGCEDPRIVEDEEGRYIMTYTAYDGKTARLCVATSTDLLQWEKHGLAFGEEYVDLWSKSGAIVCRREGARMVAVRIQDKYWMYWGDTEMKIATSDDLIHWTPLKDDNGQLQQVFTPRKGQFDSRLVEPGPPPILTEAGILFIYNSMNLDEGGDPNLLPGTYTAGQVLMDAEDPTRLLKRTASYFIKPEEPYEIQGQVGKVVFVEGWVYYQDQWFIYYGTADSKIAVARYQPEAEQGR